MTARKSVQPPPITTSRRDPKASYWYLALEPLTRKKGKWQMIRKYPTHPAANQAATRIRNGENRGLPEGQWDACGRMGELWVRFLGK